jgi:hypothetical protein
MQRGDLSVGIEATLLQVTPFQLKRLVQSPDLVDAWVFPEDGEEEMLIDDGLYIGKSLYGLHFMITGEDLAGAEPEVYTVFGKHDLTDCGYDCRYLMPEEVKAVWDVLAEMTEAVLSSNFDVDLMNSIPIYPPAGWHESDFDYLYELFKELVEYYQDAVERQNGIIHLVH